MNKKHFVDKHSVVRKIWGRSDTILFIFAGAAAEFALNKAVDWLYFTGRLPADPLGRLFSTVAYARRIIFLPYGEALAAINGINAMHKGVEKKRRENIPQSSYRDVLYMLIDYSIRVHELLEQKLSEADKKEVFDVFCRVGSHMGIQDLPETYDEWLMDRERHLLLNLERGRLTENLFRQYRLHLGPVRYWLLLQVQHKVCPPDVKKLLESKASPVITPGLAAYKLSRWVGMDIVLKSFLLPSEYKQQILDLDVS